tara:strand:+ start:677 stop:901 length:225 start_codon:yes stop_codon:yes gene_type:complete
MSSMTGEWCCSECESENAYQESFDDGETGHVMGCFDCGYYDVYREDSETGQQLEDYQGYEHVYREQDLEEKNDE